jgi:thymidine phosphorylase
VELGVSPTDQELLEVISAARDDKLDEEKTAELSRSLAASGETVEGRTNRTADVASTGGPASLSTLLCPLFLKAFDWIVPKLGVPGRPAGGLDVLSRIPGYRVDLSSAEVAAVLQECGYAHFAAGGRIAPLDARLFTVRQQLGAQTVPTLVTASLLSKKLAVGVGTVGLDVRVAAHGNFGSDMATARKNAQFFRRVAAVLGISATCFLTDASRPYQPYIGRGEALLALFRLFAGAADHWLIRHADQCAWMAAASVGLPACPAASLQAYDAFVSNVRAQGGSIDGFEAIASGIADRHRFSVLAERSGFPVVDLERVRNAIVVCQKRSTDDGAYPDPAGVILVAEGNVPVVVGDPIMTVRVETMADDFLDELAACVTMSEVPPSSVGEKIGG